MKKYIIKGLFKDNTTLTIETNSMFKVALFKSRLKKMDIDLIKLSVNKKEELL